MRAHIITLVIINTDDLGAEEVRDVLEHTRYPNHCIAPSVEHSVTYDVGEWDDNHPLNLRATDPIAWLKGKTMAESWGKHG